LSYGHMGLYNNTLIITICQAKMLSGLCHFVLGFKDIVLAVFFDPLNMLDTL